MADSQINTLISWLPTLVVLGVWLIFILRTTGGAKQAKSLTEENTNAIRENTAALKAVLAKFEERVQK